MTANIPSTVNLKGNTLRTGTGPFMGLKSEFPVVVNKDRIVNSIGSGTMDDITVSLSFKISTWYSGV